MSKRSPSGFGIADAYLACQVSLKRYIARFLYRPEDIDDIAQESFLRAYSATRGRELESPKAYLFQVARTMALKELARKSRQILQYLDDAEFEHIDGGSSQEEEFAASQKVRLYCEAIAALPPQCRKVFLMRKYQALSHGEIAASLGISVSAVEKHIAFGVERCKNYVDAREQPQSPTATPPSHGINRRGK